MKKILSLILALAMAFSLAVPAFAETTGTISSGTSGTASGSSNISGSVNNTTAAYVMVIPSGNTNLDMKSTTAQDIGNLTVKLNSSDASKTFDTQKKVSVSIASTNKGKLKNTTETIASNNTLDYTLGMTAVTNTTVSDTSVTTSEWSDSADSNPTVDFAAEGITSTGTSVAMTATMASATAYQSVANGTYRDTLTFSASVKDKAVAATGVTIDNAPATQIVVGATGTLTATVAPDNSTDTVVWSSSKTDVLTIDASTGAYTAVGVGTATVTATAGAKTDTCSITVKVAPTPVTLAGTSLTTTNLGTETPFNCSGTAYTVYNGFIATSNGSNWQNALDFVAALNSANYDGHSDWKLLDSEAMATAWYNSFDDVNTGSVGYLWSSVEDESDDEFAHCLNLEDGDWTSSIKCDSPDYDGCGFVVLRPAN